MKEPLKVAVLGASDDPERYANRALRMLHEHGHHVIAVTPKSVNLPGMKVVASLSELQEPVDTVTLYVNPRVVESLAEEILAARPRRVIFNPGTEHPGVAARLQAAGIAVEEACTLVLLSTGQFD